MATNPYYYQRYANKEQLGRIAAENQYNQEAFQPAAKSPANISPGQVASAVGGAAELAGNAISMSNQKLNINTQLAPVQYDQSMKPVYTGGSLASDLAGAKPQGATGGEILSGVGTGAAAGATFGPWGAAIGAVVGGASSLIGGGVRKNKQRREKRRGEAVLRGNQSQFNAADQSFRDAQASREDYLDRTNSNARLYNLYRAQRG